MNKLILILGAISLIAVGTMVFNQKSNSTNHSVLTAFKKFKRAHGKTYESEEVEAFRFNIFSSNLAYINYENGRQSEYTLAANKFADLSSSEFAA